MINKNKKEKSNIASDNFEEMCLEFGSAITKVFDDPKLQFQAQEFKKSAIKSARTIHKRFKDKEVKEKFRKAGLAAEKFGKNVAEYFNDEK